MTVNPATQITLQPAPSTTLCKGQPLLLTAAATGDGTISYEWFRSAVSVGTSQTLSIPAVTSADAGSYTVVATASCGTATSAVAMVVVDTAPTITTQPASTAVASGSPASFTVVAGGTEPLSYA